MISTYYCRPISYLFVNITNRTNSQQLFMNVQQLKKRSHSTNEQNNHYTTVTAPLCHLGFCNKASSGSHLKYEMQTIWQFSLRFLAPHVFSLMNLFVPSFPRSFVLSFPHAFICSFFPSFHPFIFHRFIHVLH